MQKFQRLENKTGFLEQSNAVLTMENTELKAANEELKQKPANLQNEIVKRLRSDGEPTF